MSSTDVVHSQDPVHNLPCHPLMLSTLMIHSYNLPSHPLLLSTHMFPPPTPPPAPQIKIFFTRNYFYTTEVLQLSIHNYINTYIMGLSCAPWPSLTRRSFSQSLLISLYVSELILDLNTSNDVGNWSRTLTICSRTTSNTYNKKILNISLNFVASRKKYQNEHGMSRVMNFCLIFFISWRMWTAGQYIGI